MEIKTEEDFMMLVLTLWSSGDIPWWVISEDENTEKLTLVWPSA